MNLRPWKTIRLLESALATEVQERQRWEGTAKAARLAAAGFEAQLREDPESPSAKYLVALAENDLMRRNQAFYNWFCGELQRWCDEQRGALDKLSTLAADPFLRKARTA